MPDREGGDTRDRHEYVDPQVVIDMTFTIRNLDTGVENRLSELASKNGRTMEAEAAAVLTAATRGEVQDNTEVMDLYVSARQRVSKEALAPPTGVDFTPDGF